jgi:predicted transport protein
MEYDLLLLELVNAQSVPDATAGKPAQADIPAEPDTPKATSKDKSLDEQLAVAPTEIRDLYQQTTSYLNALDDDVQEKRLKLWTAFRRLKNFACVIVYPNRLVVTLRLDPESVELDEGFSRDVSQVGHWGTGDVELTLRKQADFERAKPLLERSYTEG